MQVKKTDNNAFENVNVILNSLLLRTHQAKRTDHPAILDIGQGLNRVIQSL